MAKRDTATAGEPILSARSCSRPIVRSLGGGWMRIKDISPVADFADIGISMRTATRPKMHEVTGHRFIRRQIGQPIAYGAVHKVGP